MLTRFSRGIRVDDVTSRTLLVGSGGKAVGRKRAHKRGGQRGMVSRQLIQLTRREHDLFHGRDSELFLFLFFFSLATSVVDVVEHGLVAVHLQQVLEFSVHDDRHVHAGIVSKMKHQLQLSAQFGVQHRTVQVTVGSVFKCEQREGASLSPLLSRDHVTLALAQTAGGFEEAVIAPHVQSVRVVNQLHGLVRVFLPLH